MGKCIKFLKYVIGWPLSVVALFFIAKTLFGNANALLQLHEINFFFLGLAIVGFIAFFFLRAFFWQKLLRAKNMHFSFKDTAYIWGTSELKRYIPGSVWSIFSRSNAYTKQGSEKKAIFTSILYEAEFLLVSCLLVSLFSLNFLLFGLAQLPFSWITSGIASGVILIFSCVFLFQKKFLSQVAPFTQHFLPNLDTPIMIRLLAIMTSAFFLFGLATFFAIDAVTTLYLPHILPLVAFFVFAFLAGYLSFFAPMGLGVREGVVTVGLARYIPLADAALGALFSRIVQIFSELIFLLLCVIWKKVQSIKLAKIEQFLLEHKYEVGLFIAVSTYVLYFTAASFYRYINFYTGRFDLGNMDQTVWNTIHGRIFQLTNPDGTNIVSRLAFHADFMLVLLSPLYLIWQDPRMLLLIQSVAIGTGAFFLYAIAYNVLKKKSLALAFSISYLLYPTLQYANLFDFHSVTIAVPLLLASWYTAMKNKFFITIALLVLAATTKEEVWIVVALFGIFLFFWKKKYFLGPLLTFFSLGTFYYIFWHAIPTARGSEHFALSYYSDFGSSPSGILKTIFLSPLKTLSVILGKGQILYLLALFGPVLFLSFLAFPILIFAAPDLGISLLSQNAQLHSIYYHYAAIPTPYIFIASVYGLFFLLKHVKILTSLGIYMIIAPALFCAYFFGPFPGAYHMSSDMFVNQLSYAPLIDDFLGSIPKRYSVAATNNVGSHLSHRQKIYTIPVGLKEADIVVFLLNDGFAQPSLSQQREMARQLDKDPQYTKLIAYKDFVVYKKKSIPTYYKRPNTNVLPLFKGN